jgi:ABC-type glycerol-3-phosphate transport system substrate-binding protein
MLLDENGEPVFQNDNYRHSLAWVELLESFMRPGAASFNTEDDTDIFLQGRAGYIIDGSWNLNQLAEAIGSDNLAIDPWPTTAQGSLSGYVKSECIYLNVNTTALSPQDHLASLRFMGYLMTPQVQTYLAEVGLIPSARAAQPRLELQRQAMNAFLGGTAYPPALLSRDGALRPIYQDALNAALQDIFEEGAAPRSALENALQFIRQRLDELRINP